MKRLPLLLAALAVAAACEKKPVEPETVSAESVILSTQTLCLGRGETFVLTATVLPEDTTEPAVLWSSDNTAIVRVDEEGTVTAVSVGSATVTATVKATPSVSASCLVEVDSVMGVDLGLSVIWASCNVGATIPEDFGNYYSWGELSPKTKYNWESYKYVIPGDLTILKYNTEPEYGTADNLTILEAADDAAAQTLGGKWRTPTKADWDEIWGSPNCKWIWTKHNLEDGTSVRGCEVVNNKTGVTLFLPFAGYAAQETIQQQNEYGYYWTADLDADYAYCAYCMDLSSDAWYTYMRYQGMPVRAVRDR